MISKVKKYFLLLVILGALFLVVAPVFAHQSGCHRWHSCPSDSGSYTCGDAGYPCQYPTYPATGGVIYPPSGYYKDCYDCPLKKVPSNSYTSGLGWDCNWGYKKIGDSCAKVIVPKNAYISDSQGNWSCDWGYKKVNNSCVKVIIPANAYVSDSSGNWSCNWGYKLVGNKCVKVVVPKNAYVSDSSGNWSCNWGYKLVGDKCIKVIVPANAYISDSYGNWKCDWGYKKVNSNCVKVK